MPHNLDINLQGSGAKLDVVQPLNKPIEQRYILR